MSHEVSSLPLGGMQAEATARQAVNWRQVSWFLGLAFGLTWLIDLVIYLNGGLTQPGTRLLMQFQMLMPAFSALLLGVFFFRDSPVYFRTNRTASRWFIYYFFLLTLLYLGGAVVVLIQPAQLAAVGQLLMIANLPGLILLIVLRLVGGKNAFAGAGMAGGRWIYWVLLGMGVVAFFGLQTLLNSLFKMGQAADIRALYPPGSTDNIPTTTLLITTAFNMIVTGPLIGLIISFGEEYGWRGFLQSQLVRLGRVRGVLLLGVIWGIWHWPVIWMGYNYPGQPVLGSLLFVFYCIILAFFLAYAVFKSKGVWTAAYLHALANQSMGYFMAAFIMPASMAFSFGIGIPGIVLGGLIVLLLLRDPVWKETEA